MTWIDFPIFAAISAILWTSGILLLYICKKRPSNVPGILFIAAGAILLILFVILYWLELDRPPLRTLGETRLWYSVFLVVVGIISFIRWKYKWLLTYSILMSVLFLLITYLKPESYNKSLMPALQSPWFIPHVIVYIFSYALLAASSIVALKGLYQYYFRTFNPSTLKLADNLVYIGFSFLTLGLIFGALWAKEAWGHYWTWDPKETWALLTWMGYIIYMHTRTYQPGRILAPLWALSLAFIVLLICWFGLNYLPSAQSSVHTYTR
jgi:ABC-type transport system involved in cytochrome c biogenesis permease subunit